MNISDFLPDVMAEARGCPEFLALPQIRYALREFCDQSRAWTVDADPVVLVGGVYEYPLDLPPDVELAVNGLLSGEFQGALVDLVPYASLPAGWRSEPWNGLKGIASRDRRAIVVYPPPLADIADPLTVTVVVRPTVSAQTCGDILGDWIEGIAAGAVARLKAMPEKPWSDRPAVGEYRSRFESAINSASASVDKGHSSAPLRVRQWSRF